MLGQCRRRCTNTTTALEQCLAPLGDYIIFFINSFFVSRLSAITCGKLWGGGGRGAGVLVSPNACHAVAVRTVPRSGVQLQRNTMFLPRTHTKIQYHGANPSDFFLCIVFAITIIINNLPISAWTTLYRPNTQCCNTIWIPICVFRGKNGGNNDGITAVFSDINTALFHFFNSQLILLTLYNYANQYIDNI